MKRTLVVAGACLKGGGYPNALATLDALRSSGSWTILDRAYWLPEGVHLWRAARGPWRDRFEMLIMLVVGSARSLATVLRQAQSGDVVYAPYPAVFLLFWASLIPHRWRPRIVADAYISLWDSMFRDRRGRGEGATARLLRWFEGRALRAAHRVVADTSANRAWMVDVFRLDPWRVVTFPLAIDSAPYLALPDYAPRSGVLKVLFVGTLIPLHGVRIIAEAVRLIGRDANITFEFIGDGQDAPVLEALEALKERAPMSWRRGWASADELAEAIAGSDICLGVFGGPDKAARVFPFKLYLAMAAGRPVLTQLDCSFPGGMPLPPWFGVEPCASAVVGALLSLRDAPAERAAMARAGREYFTKWLNPAAIVKCWSEIAKD